MRAVAAETFARLRCAETDDCVLWPHSTNRYGYGQMRSGKKTLLVHIVVCAARRGPRPTLTHEAAHRCGVRHCMNYRHLRWATPKENEADKILHGTHLLGRRTRYLSSVKADELVRRYAAGGCTHRSLATEFGVSSTTVHRTLERSRS